MSEASNNLPPDPSPEADVPVGRQIPISLLLLALPIIASMLSRTVMTFADFVMVSQLGTEAQAAITPAGLLLFTVIGFGWGLLAMVNSFVSQALGRGNHEACASFAWQGIYLSAAMSLACIPMWFVAPAIFSYADHAPAVQEMELTYLRIGLWGVLPTLAAMGITNFFNGLHKPSVGLWTSVTANVFNIIANYVLIFGALGIPAMGIAGAAWATNLAALLQVSLLLGWMLHPKVDARYHTRRAWRFHAQRCWRILWYGLPGGVQLLIDVGTFAIFTLVLIGGFGTVQLAANNLVCRLLELSFMPTVGLGAAVTAAVGKAIGQGRHDIARTTAHWGAGFSMAYMGSIGVMYLFAGGPIASLLSDDPEVIAWSIRLFYLCAVFQLFDALNINYVHALRGAGDTHWPAIVQSVLAITIFVGLGWVIGNTYPQWGSLGPWAAATLYVSLLGCLVTWRFIRGPWESIDLMHEEPPQDEGLPTITNT